MKYVFDAHAWIEYLQGSKQGEDVCALLQSERNQIFVLPITIAEVVAKIKRDKGNYKLAHEAIVSNATVIETSDEAALEAGIVYVDTRKKLTSFGIVDALVLVTAAAIKAKVVTGDYHFKQFKNVLFLD